ncbi:MAG TPA: glutaredoxin family protein [Acidiferrobacterales bacterium]|nr:glutaredoxin family protein [Acidiferrobacterales bacterium]
MARNTLIAVLVTMLAVAPAYAAKLYKWVDERGNISYQDRPPPEGVGKVEEKNLRDGGGDSGSPAAAEAAAKSPVMLYMVPKCSSCDAARVYLKKRGVPFTEVNVSEKNPQAQQEMRKKIGELSVPTITVGSKVMQGYVESLLAGELDQAGYPKPEAKPEAAETPEAAPAQ